MPTLVELLGPLPKDLWPTNANDTLTVALRKEWFKKNLTGRRARCNLPPGNISFELDDKGNLEARLTSPHASAKLFGSEWVIDLAHPGSNMFGELVPSGVKEGFGRDTWHLSVTGLNGQQAKILEAWNGTDPLEFTFTIVFVTVVRDTPRVRIVPEPDHEARLVVDVVNVEVPLLGAGASRE